MGGASEKGQGRGVRFAAIERGQPYSRVGLLSHLCLGFPELRQRTAGRDSLKEEQTKRAGGGCRPRGQVELGGCEQAVNGRGSWEPAADQQMR